jgi:hypothetical protein
MDAVRGHLLLTNCLEDELTRPNIELALKADRPLGSLTAFLVFGIGTGVLAVIALFVMFRRRGWMGKKS